VAVSVGGVARAVGATLVATVAGTADVTGLELRDGRTVDGDGSSQSEEDGGEFHGEGLVVFFGMDWGDVCDG
jgi:hypothetical protein